MSDTGGSPRSLKRDHDSFRDEDLMQGLLEPCSVPADFLEMLEKERLGQQEETSLNTEAGITRERDGSPARSMTGSVLTDAGSTTPDTYRGRSPALLAGSVNGDGNGHTPMQKQTSAFAALDGTAAPPAKKVKLSFAEKEMKRINKEIKDRERAEEKARKEAERLAHAEEKARKDAERLSQAEEKAKKIAEEKARKDAEKEAEKRRKELEKEEKRAAQEAEKAAKEAEKAAKEEKRRIKEEEKLKAAEAKKNKDKGQMKLNHFLTKGPQGGSPGIVGRTASPPPPNSSLAAPVASPAPTTPSKPEKSTYEKLFPAFFVQSGVQLAPINRFERDDAALETARKNIDEYILGDRSPGGERPFDAMSLFNLPTHKCTSRGKHYMSVRDIMNDFESANTSQLIDLTTDSQNSQIKRRGELLRKIPLKFLKFQEDVRPPYRGTYTSRPVNGITKMARNPLRKDLPNTDYEYDSEAEWIEDEDAEDLKSEGDEDEEVDDDEDMDGFLDDEGDEMANAKRLVIQGDLEPVSTGLCWEDSKKRNENVKMIQYRMEIILDPTIKSIDPFSTSYWEPVPSKATMDPPRIPLNNLKATSLSHNGSLHSSSSSKNVKPFFAPASSFPLNSANVTTSKPRGRPAKPASENDKPKKLITDQDLPAFKAAIQGSDLSKIGLIEVLKKKFPAQKAAAVKATLEVVAKRVGNKEVDKRWVLVDEPKLGGADAPQAIQPIPLTL